MNSPGAKQPISLLLVEKSKVTLTLSLWTTSEAASVPRLTQDWAAVSTMDEDKEWPPEWTDEIETVVMNRADCVSAEGELPDCRQRSLSWWKGWKEHNGAPVQVKFRPVAEPQMRCPKKCTQEKQKAVLYVCAYFSLEVMRTKERTGDINLIVCFMDQAKTYNNFSH